MDITLIIRCVAGPDSGWSARLRPGRYWLGRTHGDLQMIDPAVEAHHALVELGDDGLARLLQVAGRPPALVDGEPVHGWVTLRRSSVIEVGTSRLELVDPSGVPVASSARLYAPLDESDAELRRFERDVVRVSAAVRSMERARRGGGGVALGVAHQRLEIDVLDRASEPFDVVSLAHPVAALLDRHATAELPVVTVIGPERPMAIVGLHAPAVARRVRLQLTPRQRARLLTLTADEADRFRGAGRPMIVLVPDLTDVPTWCVGVLDVGATWHGTWQPDVIDRPHDIIRLHVAGASSRRTAPGHPGLHLQQGTSREVIAPVRSRADVGGALVAEQVARAGAEIGGDVARVPQSAR